MVQSLKANLAQYKFLSALVNPEQMDCEILSVRLTVLIKSVQAVKKFKCWQSIPSQMVFKCSQLMLSQIG